MKTLEMADAPAALRQCVRKARFDPLILTANGKPVVGIANDEDKRVRLCTNAAFMALIERSRARQRKEGGIPSGEMRRRLGLKRRGHGR